VAVPISEPPSDTIAALLPEVEAGHGLSMGPAGRVLGGIDPSSVFRFVTRGTRTADGRLVKLEAIRIGAKWVTTRPAISRYLRALANPIEATPAKPNTPKLSKPSNSSAEKLRAMGC
jgi:hypothetical protein